jgi:hypothetical protein
MNTLSQPNGPQLTIRGSRFAMPAFGATILIILGCYVFFAASNPFMSFGTVLMTFFTPLIALISMNLTTRAVFYDDRCKVARIEIFYENIVFIKRGRFLLTIHYNRPNEARAKPRRASLSFWEMRRHEQDKCLEILRQSLTEKAVLNSTF